MLNFGGEVLKAFFSDMPIGFMSEMVSINKQIQTVRFNRVEEVGNVLPK